MENLNSNPANKRFLYKLKENANYTYTENGAISNKSTLSKVLDMFAFGGAYRSRTNDDCIVLFRDALAEDPDLALKCLFYIRDIRGGQGERRFFRVCYNWLAKKHPDIALRNMEYLPQFGRWDDVWYTLFDTPCELDALNFICTTFEADKGAEAPSLLGKWLPSLNASSEVTKGYAQKIRKFLGLSPKEYRQTLSSLRKRIKIVERSLSQKEYEDIEFDKVPAIAGLKYKAAFSRIPALKDRYLEFIQDKNTKVNAETLNPYLITKEVLFPSSSSNVDPDIIQKYWDNLPDYYNGREEKGIAVVDTSGSMECGRGIRPLAAAVGLGLYIAERGKGPFANHMITFSFQPALIDMSNDKTLVERMQHMAKSDWGFNTDIEKVFDLLLKTSIEGHFSQDELPQVVYIFSDMEFDAATWDPSNFYEVDNQTLMESIEKKWRAAGYEMPRLVFWNLNARHNLIPKIEGKISFVSGFSPVIIQQVLQGLDGREIMLSKLLSDRYKEIKGIA